MKFGAALILLILTIQSLKGQSELDQYNSRYVLAVQAHLGDPTEANLNMKALAAFQLYYYHHDGYRKNEADRYKADAKASWQLLENSEDKNLQMSALIGLGSIYYMEGYAVKRKMENISISDGEAYGIATKQLNSLMNEAYQYLVRGDRSLPKLAKETLESLEEDGASNSRINEVRESFYDDYTSILDTMSKLFSMSMEMQLYNDYQDRLEQVEQGELFLKPYPNLPEQLFFN